VPRAQFAKRDSPPSTPGDSTDMPIKLPSFRPRRDAYPPDLWTKCPSCEEMLFNKQLDKVQRVCPNCGHHFRLSADARIGLLVDHGTFVERDPGLQSVDPLSFVDQKTYPDRVAAAQLATGMRDAAAWGTATLDGRPVALCVMDFGFMGGSMGAVVGEKVTRAAEYALVQRMPLIVVSASGGARMQEGTLALMQLVKTVGALERLRTAGVPYISVLSDPTTGGVFASFAVLGDVNLTEPNALIGFAGARVSAGTIAQELPVGFQRSEFLFEHGFIDRVVHRSQLRAEIAMLLGYLVPASRSNGSNGDVEPLGLPSFRPLSFLTTLAERVMPSEPEPPPPAPTNGPRASGRPIAPVEAPVQSFAPPTVAVDTPPATEPAAELSEPSPVSSEPSADAPAPVAATQEPESAMPEAVAASPIAASDVSIGDEAPSPVVADEGGRSG
jgi:acetyl-CoA carboxylase carboxyl transferase subunit beta